MNTNVVVFDAFGTLLRFNKNHMHNPYKQLRHYATKEAAFHPVTYPASLDNYAWTLGANLTEDQLQEVNQMLRDELDHVIVFDEVYDVLKAVRNMGKKVAVCSNIAYDYCDKVEELFGDYVDQFIFSCNVGLSKPTHGIYERVMTKFPEFTDKQEYLMIGDSRTNDYDAPREFGWRAMHLDREGKHPGLTYSRLNSIFFELK